MSLCINPDCPQPDHPDNGRQAVCQGCGAPLWLEERYRVMRILSRNTGFGTVYEAYERHVPKVLKVLRPDRAENPKVLRLFRHEAEVLSRIHHPGVPQVTAEGYFTVDLPPPAPPLHCIVMEKIDGLNLRQWMQQQGNHPISEQQGMQWLTQLADILQRLHGQNYFHRDIKPENVMVRANGQLVLVDFGAVREMTGTYLAQVGSPGGVTRISSAGYTPPEQEQGQAVPQSDFYALGRTLIYLLTTFSPNDTALYDPLRNQFEWRSHAPQVSEDFAALLDRLIAPRVVDRPAHAQAILDRLHQVTLNRWVDHQYPVTVLPETTLRPDTTAGGTLPATEIGGPAGARSLQPSPAASNPDPAVPPQSSPPTEPPQSAAPPAHPPQADGPSVPEAETATAAAGRVPSAPASVTSAVAPPTAPRGSIAAVIPGPWRWRGLVALAGVGAIALAGLGLWLRQGPGNRAVPTLEADAALRHQTLSGHQSPVNALALLPDGRLLSAGADKTIVLWDLSTGEVRRRWTDQPSFVNALILSPDAETLYSGTADGTLQAWAVETEAMVWQQPVHAGALNAIALTPDGQTLVSGGADGTIQIIDAATGAIQARLPAHEGPVNTVALTADGQTIISGGSDRAIHLWQLDSGEKRATLTGHESFVNDVLPSPDGRTLYSASADGTVRLWDLATAEAMQTLTGHSSYVNALALSRDGRTLASGSADETVRLWSVTGEPIATLTALDTTVDYLLLTADNHLITASRNDPAVQVWDLEALVLP